jgi:hypothetical protein
MLKSVNLISESPWYKTKAKSGLNTCITTGTVQKLHLALYIVLKPLNEYKKQHNKSKFTDRQDDLVTRRCAEYIFKVISMKSGLSV